MIDVVTVTILFSLLFQFVQWCLIIFFNETQQKANESTEGFKQDQAAIVLILYCIYWFVYFFLCIGLTGTTLGMLLVGVRVVNCNKSHPYKTVSGTQALIRTCLLPITLTMCWPLGVIGLVRRDGRMLHDLVAQTGMIYLWDAKMAKARKQMMRQDNRTSFTTTTDSDDVDDDDSDGLDAYIDQDLNDMDGSANVDEERPFIDQEATSRGEENKETTYTTFTNLES
jgi:uncharacterized RDD family membrane protein YckC